MISNPFIIVTSIEDQVWDEFVARHPQGNIFQTRYIYEVYLNTRNYIPLKLFAVDRDNQKLGGVLTSVTVNEAGGILSAFSSHSIIQGGPLVEPGQEKTLVPLLLAEHDRLSRSKALYCETRNMYDVKGRLEAVKDYSFEDHLNILIHLDRTEEELWHQLHRAKKNHINKAQKLNIIIEELGTRDQLPILYSLIKETYRNAKIPLADISLFKSAFDVLYPRGMVRFNLAKYQDQYVAGQVFLMYNNVVYAWYLGAARDYLNCHANEYITWNTLKWGLVNGYREFDFGGAGNPSDKYGPRDYKREFGGEVVNFGRYKHIYKPFEMKLTDVGFKIYQKLMPG